MLNNMKIGKRLISAFVIVTLIVSLGGIVGFVLLTKTDASYGNALVANGFALGDIGDYNAYLNKGAGIVRDVIMLTEEADIQAAQAELEVAKKLTVEALERAKVNCTTPDELAIIAKIDTAQPNYVKYRDEAVNLGLQNRNDEALKVFREQARPYLIECTEGGQELMALNIKMGHEVSNDLTNQSRLGMIAIAATIVAGFVVAMGLAVYISRGISKPVSEIEDAAQKMAEGNYDVTINYQSKDEIGSLADSMRMMTTTTNTIVLDVARALGEVADGNFNIVPETEYIGVFEGVETAITKIITDLSETMAQIKLSASQVSSGSEQVSSGAQALAQGATEQASSVEELSASINEVSDQIKDNANNASTASNVVRNVDQNINTSNVQMTEMMNAMTEISDSSSQISKIIKTIEDIAFQTNILALNAAVEAARAGAAGKGFAVVADEVRNLATKSSEAAKQTNMLIEGSVKSVENGVKIAAETAKSLADVVTGAQEITELITKITQASEEQANSISQINIGVEQISSVVQTNSATSEESAAASEELNGQANLMNEMVAKFILKE